MHATARVPLVLHAEKLLFLQTFGKKARLLELNWLKEREVIMIVSHHQLEPEVLMDLIRSCLSSEHDYEAAGNAEIQERIASICHRLDAGEAVLVFDEEMGSCEIVPTICLNRPGK